MSDARNHWDGVYSAKNEAEVSWYQSRPEQSLALIRSATSDNASPVVDVGGGASRLVDGLLAGGYSDVTVLDVSDAALSRSRARLGQQASRVSWIIADITNWLPVRTWRVWHDRAVFHFLTAGDDQDAYLSALKAATISGSVAIMSCFALDGPDRCSGLPVQRYSAATLAARIGADFELMAEALERHTTPAGSVQSFTYAMLRRI